MSKSYVLAIDQGTTSMRAILFDEAGRPRPATAQVPLTQIYPAPGQAEHDPEEIWRAALRSVVGCSRLPARGRWPPSASPISARPPSCGTGRPASRSPMPSSGKTAARRRFASAREGWGAHVAETTGLAIHPLSRRPSSPGYSTTSPACARAPRAERCVFGTIHSFLLFKLTGGGVPRHRRDERRAHQAVRSQKRNVGRAAPDRGLGFRA